MYQAELSLLLGNGGLLNLDEIGWRHLAGRGCERDGSFVLREVVNGRQVLRCDIPRHLNLIFIVQKMLRRGKSRRPVESIEFLL